MAPRPLYQNNKDGVTAWCGSISATSAISVDGGIKNRETEDLSRAGAESTIIAIVAHSQARLSSEAKSYAEQAQLELHILPSSEAVFKSNELLKQGAKAAALIHITCQQLMAERSSSGMKLLVLCHQLFFGFLMCLVGYAAVYRADLFAFG
jgi:hypothetical protein